MTNAPPWTRTMLVLLPLLWSCARGEVPTSTGLAGLGAQPGASAADGDDGRDRCYPYLPAADGSCPTACDSIDDCAGSRGPADFAENGWPLDCINRECVPLPPDHVYGR